MAARSLVKSAAAFAIACVSALALQVLAQSSVRRGNSTHSMDAAAEAAREDGALAAGIDASALATIDRSGCPEGLAVVDRAGHCCAPGQHMRGGTCAGLPTSCPAGFAPGPADGSVACVPRACENGRERAADGVHCCWPGQVFEAGRCRGAPVRCPEGSTPLGEGDCAPPIGSESVRAPHAAPAGMVWVPPGSFVMGERGASAARYVTLGGFWIDRTEVTAAAYRRCVNAGSCPEASDPFGLLRAPDAPAVNVTHAMAAAYCAWRGGRLPTEAEWEYAARGAEGRTYPWGERAPDCSLARALGCGASPIQVGRLPAGASPFGALDMAGNVAEWTADRWEALAPGSFRDPTTAAGGHERVVRGGAFDEPASALRASARMRRDEREARYDLGFRCVRSAPESFVPRTRSRGS